MTPLSRPSRPAFFPVLKSQKGFLLVAALTLLATLTLIGTTAFILSSTDIRVGDNFKTNHMALQAAMAAAERAREALRVANLASTDTISFSDELASMVGANAVLNEPSGTTDDVLLSNGSVGTGYHSVSYLAYLTNDRAPAEPGGITSQTDTNNRVMITSIATGPNGAQAKVETVVGFVVIPPSPSTIYSKDNVTLNGKAINISGNDGSTCGGPSLAPVYTMNPATTTTHGDPTLTGSPSTPERGDTDIDISYYVDALKSAASVRLTSDPSPNQTYGSSTNYVTVYADAEGTQDDKELKLNNVTGHGILLVRGDLEIAGSFTWNGLIFVTGKIKTTGGGSDAKNIQGLIYTGSSSLGDAKISGSVTAGYNSCNVRKATTSQPLIVFNWKNNY